MKRGLLIVKLLLFNLFFIGGLVGQTQQIFWRSQAANGNWFEGDNQCNEIGTGNSQWWYPHFTPNNSRNAPNCYGVYDLVFENNQELSMNNSEAFFDVNRITFNSGATSSRTLNGEGIDLRVVSTNQIIIRNLSEAHHTFNNQFAIHNNPTEINPVNGDLTFTGTIFTNGNYIDVFGDNGKTLTITSDISGTGGIAIKQNSTVQFTTTNKTYSGNTTLEAGTLELQGSLANSAVTVQSGATLKINGDNVTIASLTVEAGGIVNVEAGKSLTITGALANSGTLTLKSTASGTASLITNGTVSVNVTVERYLSHGKYHYVSSPISNGTYSILQQGPNNENDFFQYNTATNIWEDLNDGDVGTTELVVGKGYAVQYAGAGSVTKSFTGTVNEGTVTYSVTSEGVGLNAGTNLIGNPYPSALDAKSFLTDGDNTELNGAVYLWDEGTNYDKTDYAVITSDGTATAGGSGVAPTSEFIGTGQGFFVLANSTGSISFKNSMRATTNNQFFKSKDEDIQRVWLNISNDNNDFNQIAFSFHDRASKGYDRLFDAFKLSTNSNLNLYSLIGNQKFVIQAMPTLTEPSSVLLGFKTNTTGVFTFELSKLENFEPGTPVILEDRLIGEQVDLSINPEYTFSVSEPGSCDDRFVLYFKSSVGITDPVTTNKPLISIQNNQLTITNLEEGKTQVKVMDIMGRVIDFSTFNNNSAVSMPLSLQTGIYILEIRTNNHTFADKVFVG